MVTDAELVARCRTGDAEAWNELGAVARIAATLEDADEDRRAAGLALLRALDKLL